MMKTLSAWWDKVTVWLPHISFLSPMFLWLLLLVPLLVGLYVLLLRRRKKVALRYGNMGVVKLAVGPRAWRRHLPPALFLAALTLMLLAIARPTAEVRLPSNQATVIMAMDVSGSMRARDVNPSRIAASQVAAKAFIKNQPKDVLVGVVAFAGTALLVQSPTTDRLQLNAAIDRFELQRATAVGSGLLVSLQTIFPADDFPINRFTSDGGFGGGYGRFGRFGGGRSLTDRGMGGGPPKKQHVPVEPGSYKNAVVILLTDGATNSGYDPIEAARIAANYGVRVYTVGFGTARGNIVGFGGFSMRAQLDEESLKRIADITRGRYFRAASAEDLKSVYAALSKQLVLETKQMEITAFFAALASILLMASAGLSLAWFSRIL